MLDALEAEDPVAERAGKELQAEFVEWFREHPDDLHAWASETELSITSSHTAQLTTTQIRRILSSAKEIVFGEQNKDREEPK